MKWNKFLLGVLVWLSTTSIFSQTFQIQNQFKETVPYASFYQGVIQELDGELHVISYNTYLKVTQDGSVEKESVLDGLGNAGGLYFEKIDDGYLIGGMSDGTNNFNVPLVIYSTDEELVGQEPFSLFYSGEGRVRKFSKGEHISKTPEGDYLIADNNTIHWVDGTSFEVIYQLEHEYGSIAGIAPISESSFAIALRNQNETVGNIIAIDTSGNHLWNRDYGDKIFQKLKPLSDGFLALTKEGNKGYQLMKLDAVGNNVWTTKLSIFEANDMILTDDGGYAIIGSTHPNVVLQKVDANGMSLWTQTYEEGIGETLTQLSDGGFGLLAFHRKASNGFTYLLKTDALGQVDQPLTRQSTSHGLMDINNIQTVFSPNGLQFYDEEEVYRDDFVNYEIPIGSGQSTMFAGGLWIGGLDEEEQFRAAAQTFFDKEDYHAGPIENNSEFYDRVWGIHRKDIDAFLTDLEDDSLDNPIPYDILYYPGVGNPWFSAQAQRTINITQPFAPFEDVNQDGVYNPMDGDFPIIKGDKALLWVMNDDKEHLNSQSLPLGVEVYCMVYGYDIPSDDVLHNTVFYEATIVNTSENDYHDVHLGQWINFEIGCIDNADFIGSNPANDFFYAYNEGEKDGNEEGECSWSFGSAPYGEQVPLQIVTFLNRSLTSTIYYSLSSSYENAAMGNPQSPGSVHNYLTGKWADGLPQSPIGNGYDPERSIIYNDTTSFVFPDNPASGEGWTSCSIDSSNQSFLHTPSMIGGTGPYDLQSGDQLHLAIAYTTFEDVPHPCPDIEPIASKIAQLKQLYQTGELARVVDSLALNVPSTLPLPLEKSKDMVDQESTGQKAMLLERTTAAKVSSTVSPNPFDKVISIKVHTINGGQINLLLSDMLGRIHLEDTYEAVKGNNQLELTIPKTLENGMYHLTIHKADEQLRDTHKLIRQQ